LDIIARRYGPGTIGLTVGMLIASYLALVLLHGFPSSSHTYEPLFARLAGQFHLIAPDYPGFGDSNAPAPKTFAYTFDYIADIIEHFTEDIGAPRYVIYLQDYGGPVGFRLVLAHPERVRGLIIQKAVAHEDGLGPSWEARRQFWRDRAVHEVAFQKASLCFETTRKRHIGSSPNVAKYDPGLWIDESAFISGRAMLRSRLTFCRTTA
jgi:pimeloyl-ACP methyl ester carboxylesterase